MSDVNFERVCSPEQTALLAQSLEKLQDFFRHEEAAVEGETNG